ncbi:MAG: SAM-dependent methyltransferase [Thermoplasmata archaeon]
MVQETNQFRYNVSDPAIARQIILTPVKGKTTDQRWVEETAYMVSLLSEAAPVGAQVLDFGVGTGRLLIPLLLKRRDLTGIGVDTSVAMAAKAGEEIQRASLSTRARVDVYQDSADLERIGQDIAPRSVSLIVCCYVLQHIQKDLLPKVFEFFKTVLAPDGRLLVLNLYRRSVPVSTTEEAAAGTPDTKDEAIEEVAEHRTPRADAWIDDGASVLSMLTHVFGAPQRIALPEDAFAEGIRQSHFCAVFSPSLSSEHGRWLHDKYERLAHHEDNLIDFRGSFFAALISALATAIALAVAYLGFQNRSFEGFTAILATVGVMSSTIWWFVINRTIAAQNLWRESARIIEGSMLLAPGWTPEWLDRPYLHHRASFRTEADRSFLERFSPLAVWRWLPLGSLVVWSAVLAYMLALLFA